MPIFFDAMPTNFDHAPKLSTCGQRVRIKKNRDNLWQNVGIVIGIELDTQLTAMNCRNIQMYRILVDFGETELASVLPCILTLV